MRVNFREERRGLGIIIQVALTLCNLDFFRDLAQCETNLCLYRYINGTFPWKQVKMNSMKYSNSIWVLLFRWGYSLPFCHKKLNKYCLNHQHKVRKWGKNSTMWNFLGKIQTSHKVWNAQSETAQSEGYL